MGPVIITILCVLILVILVLNVKFVQQSKAYVIERLAAFRTI